MSAREELAQVIGGKLDTIFSTRDFGPAQQDYKLADALLAEGYRKQRTIATAEELDALPVGSVVLHHGRSFQRYEPRTVGNYEYNIWQCPDGGFVRSREGGRLILPATVIYEPDPQ